MIVPNAYIVFRPQEDITAPELARCLQMLLGAYLDIDQLEKEKEEVSRHFEIVVELNIQNQESSIKNPESRIKNQESSAQKS